MPFAAPIKEVREGEISYDISYVNLKRNDTNELTKQKETHRIRDERMFAGAWDSLGWSCTHCCI